MEDKKSTPYVKLQPDKFTSPIHIKISKFEGSYITAEASSQTLRNADAQELEDNGSDIPAARNNLKNEYLNKKRNCKYRYIRANQDPL